MRGYHKLDILADEKSILVATPNDYHCELARAALEAGKHTISEKPVTLTVAQVDQMISTAEKNNRLFTVHQNRRWDRRTLPSRKSCAREAGKVFSIQSRLAGDGGIMHGWRGEKAHGGGMLYELGVHFLDQLYDLLGYDAFFSVHCVLNSVKNPEVDDFLILEGKDSLRVQVEIGTFILNDPLAGLRRRRHLDRRRFPGQGRIMKVNTLMPVIVMTDAGPTRTFAPGLRRGRRARAAPG